MRKTGLAALVFVAVSGGAAHAEFWDAGDWCHRVAAIARSLIGGGAPDHEIIRPPQNIDAQMVLAPPRSDGRERIIVPL